MIEETVLAVDGTRITTETGGKIPIGNREFEVGESVWTDGPFAFGTERYSGIVMPIADAKPNEVPCIVELGVVDGVWKYIIRDCSTDDLRAIEIAWPLTEYPIAFCYNNSKFTNFFVSTNTVTIKTITEDAITEQTVTLPYSGAGDIKIDAYYAADGLHWTALWDDYQYEHYFDGSATNVDYDPDNRQLVYSSTGHIAFLDYIGTELANNVDLTATVKTELDAIWNELYAIATDSNDYISFTYDIGTPAPAKLYTVPLVEKGQRPVSNMPNVAVSFDIVSFAAKKIQFNTFTGGGLFVQGDGCQLYNFNSDGYAPGDDNYVGTESDHFSVGQIGYFTLHRWLILGDNYRLEKENKLEVSFVSTEADFTYGESSGHETISGSYAGTTYDDTNDYTYSKALAYGYTFSDDDAAGTILSDGNGWTMSPNFSADIDGRYWLAKMPSGKLLFYDAIGYTLNLIDKATSSISEIHNHYLYNTRAPVITKVVKDLAAILSKK